MYKRLIRVLSPGDHESLQWTIEGLHVEFPKIFVHTFSQAIFVLLSEKLGELSLEKRIALTGPRPEMIDKPEIRRIFGKKP